MNTELMIKYLESRRNLLKQIPSATDYYKFVERDIKEVEIELNLKINNMKELEEQILDTEQVLITETYNHQYITNDTVLILKNQVLIMKTLQKILK